MNKPTYGFTLIEMMITLAVLALLFAVGLPSMTTWLQNTQIRNAAETMQAGLQVARNEALRRNLPVRFQLVDSLANGCALTVEGQGVGWVVSFDEVNGACDAGESDTLGPRILQKHSGAEGSPNAWIVATANSVRFNGLGRLADAPGEPVQIDVSHVGAAKCQPDGPMRCLRLRIAPGGGARMCDPVVMDADDPRKC